MYRPWPLRLTLATDEGVRALSSGIGTNQGRVVWTATTKILTARAQGVRQADSAPGLDRLPRHRSLTTAGKAGRRNTAHKVCRRFLKRPGTRVSRLLSSPTLSTLIARLKIKRGHRARERPAFLAIPQHWQHSSASFPPPLLLFW